MSEVFDFPEEAGPEDGEEVLVVARLEDGELNYREGVNAKGKTWRSYPFVIDEGQHSGQWVSLMLTLDPSNFYFRRDVSALTGIDVSGGGRVDGAVLEEKIKTGRFLVSLRRKDKYLNVNEIKERYDYEPPAGPSIPVGVTEPGADADVASSEDDIPF